MSRFVDEYDLSRGLVRIPWYMPRRPSWERLAVEVGGLHDVLRWFGEAVYYSFARFCILECGMPRPVPEGYMMSPREFWRGFWRWDMFAERRA